MRVNGITSVARPRTRKDRYRHWPRSHWLSSQAIPSEPESHSRPPRRNHFVDSGALYHLTLDPIRTLDSSGEPQRRVTSTPFLFVTLFSSLAHDVDEKCKAEAEQPADDQTCQAVVDACSTPDAYSFPFNQCLIVKFASHISQRYL